MNWTAGVPGGMINQKTKPEPRPNEPEKQTQRGPCENGTGANGKGAQ